MEGFYICMRLGAAILWLLAVQSTVLSDEIVVENGITYRMTRRFEKTPVTSVRMEPRTETVYRTDTVTEDREETRTTWVPVVDYAYHPRSYSWWNPFAQPQAGYELRPYVRWEARTETIKRPVTVQKVVPETKTVQVAVRTLGFSEREVVERVAIRTPTSPATTLGPGIVVRQHKAAPMAKLPPPNGTPGNPSAARR